MHSPRLYNTPEGGYLMKRTGWFFPVAVTGRYIAKWLRPLFCFSPKGKRALPPQEAVPALSPVYQKKETSPLVLITCQVPSLFFTSQVPSFLKSDTSAYLQGITSTFCLLMKPQ